MEVTLTQSKSNKTPRSRWAKIALLAMTVIASIAVLIAYQTANHASGVVPPANTISTSVLEQRYGLHVNLIAVTAAGGLVDVRFKVLDAAKAKALLDDPKNFPALKVADRDATLIASEDSRAQVPNLKDNGLIMILFPNAGSAAQSGSPVNVTFGDMQLEPIAAK
jgi:hypothetical protein